MDKWVVFNLNDSGYFLKINYKQLLCVGFYFKQFAQSAIEKCGGEDEKQMDNSTNDF